MSSWPSCLKESNKTAVTITIVIVIKTELKLCHIHLVLHQTYQDTRILLFKLIVQKLKHLQSFTKLPNDVLEETLLNSLTLSRRRSLNQSIDLQSKSMDRLLYDRELRYQIVKIQLKVVLVTWPLKFQSAKIHKIQRFPFKFGLNLLLGKGNLAPPKTKVICPPIPPWILSSQLSENFTTTIF